MGRELANARPCELANARAQASINRKKRRIRYRHMSMYCNICYLSRHGYSYSIDYREE